MTQTTTQPAPAALPAVLRNAAPVVVYEQKVYVRTKVTDFVIEWSPRPAPPADMAAALEHGRWVGYQLGRELIKWVMVAREAEGALQFVRGGSSGDVMMKLRKLAEDELSAANARLDQLKGIALDLAAEWG